MRKGRLLLPHGDQDAASDCVSAAGMLAAIRLGQVMINLQTVPT